MFHFGAAVAALVARGVGSVVTVALAALFPWCNQPKPLIADSIEVAVVSMPKSATKMPDRAAVKRRAPKGETPKKVKEPPPVKQSDLVHRTKEPEPKPGTEQESSRRDVVADLERQKLIDDLLQDAPEGPKDRLPTDPDGVEGAVASALVAGAMGDPAYVAWHQKVTTLFRSKFSLVIPRDDLEAKAVVSFDPATGKVMRGGTRIVEKSGVTAFDMAAQRALDSVPSVPLPPAKYLENTPRPTVTIVFTPTK